MYKNKVQRSSNRHRILECIFRNAPISRTEIAEITGITPATTTNVIGTLLAENWVIELGEQPSEELTSGRKRIALDINADAAYSIGAEFNAKAMSVVIANLRGVVICEKSLPYSQAMGNSITENLIDEIQALLDCSNLPMEKFIGIGIAVPGHVDRTQLNIVSNQTIWKNFRLKAVEKAFPLPVVIENNVRCMALGQYLFQPNASPDNFSFFHVGLGMFCANIVDEELFLGNAYVSGEIGHNIVDPYGLRCECGKYGCLQTVSSEYRLLQNARLLYENDPASVLRHLVTSKDEITIKDVTTAYMMGDEVIGTSVSKALKFIGIATSNIAILMNPEKIFLHGEMFDCPQVHDELMDIINHQLLFVGNGSFDTVTILPYSTLNGAIGGSALAITNLLLREVPEMS